MATHKQTLQIGTASWALFPEDVAVGPGAIATVPTGDSFPPTTEWRSISSGANSFQQLVLDADGDVDQVLDLGANEGIGYAFTEEDDDPASFTRGFYGTGNLKITNARLSGGRVLPNWVDQGGGVFRHAFDLSIYNATTNPGGRTTVFNPQAYMYDTDGDTRTTIGVWPAPPASHDQFRRTWNPNWLHLKDTAIDLCTVHTLNGDDATGFGATITGITITDATTVATLRAKFLEISTAGYTASSITLYMLCGQNRIEFARVDSYVDGGSTFTISVTAPSGNVFYPGYLRLALLAHPVDVLNEGDYAIDYDNNELVYKFPGGVSHGRMQFSVGNSCYISTSSTDESDVTFENCELSGWGNAGSTIKVEGVNDVVIDKCTVNYMADGIYCTTMTQCVVDDWYGIACTTAAQSEAATFLFEKNSFGPHADQRSCIYIQTIHPLDTSPIRPTLVKDNYFSLPLSTHGQGVSVYENSWQNAELSHNVFVDCMSPMSFQPNGANYDLATFKFENNLTVKTKDAYIVQGQQGHAFNSSNDDYVLDPGAVGTQEVHWRYNTVWADPSVATTMAEYPQTQAVNLIGIRQSTVYVENNVLTSVGTPYVALATKLDSDGHYHANNLMTTPNATYGQNAYGANDLADADALGRIMQTRKLEVQGIYTTAATDGGRIGIRWDSTPDMLSVANLPKNWYEYYPAQALPALDPADFSLVTSDDGDLRV